MKKILLIAFCLLMGLGVMAQERVIKREQLPEAARHFVMDNWNNVSISKARQVTEGYKISYKVILVDQTVIVFNRDGGWRSISATKEVSESAIPASIRTYVAANHRNAKVLKMEKKSDGYEVILDNEKNLVFDLKGNFLR